MKSSKISEGRAAHNDETTTKQSEPYGEVASVVQFMPSVQYNKRKTVQTVQIDDLQFLSRYKMS